MLPLIALGLGAGYLLYRTLKSKPTILGAAAASRDTFESPSVVIANPPKVASSRWEGTVRSVSVSGGSRRYPLYGDKNMAGYEHPAVVSIVFNNGSRKTLTKLEFLTVQGGKMRFDSPGAPGRSMAARGYGL